MAPTISTALPPLALVANLAVMPMVTAIVMPFAVLSVLAMPFGLEGPFLWVMGMGLTYAIVAATWISDLSPFDAIGILPVGGVIALTVALVLAVLPTTVAAGWCRLTCTDGRVAAGRPDRCRRCWCSENGRLVGVANRARRAGGQS